MKTVVLLACFAVSSLGHDIITTNLTFTRDISRIFARRCVACHAEGSSIPLVTYQEARPWAVDIKEQVLSRTMPPWGAVKGFGHLMPDDGLTQEEIMIIAGWVIGGAPEGEESLLPRTVPLAPAVSRPPMRDALQVQTSTVLSAPVRVAGVRPMADKTVGSARVIAVLPDGRVEPLLWLYQYDPKENKTFAFREIMPLPNGTRIESSAPLRFALETIGSSPER